MLGIRRPPGTRRQAGTKPAAVRAAAAAGVLLAGGAALAGCQQAAGSVGQIRVGSAAVPVPAAGGNTDGYLVIQNLGPADRLVAVRTSDGGHVTFRAPAPGGAARMRTVPDIAVPAGATIRLNPDSFHLAITGAGPMQGGTQITLTLVFAKAGKISVPALVTNPETGGGSYFLN
jgi:periplasmic copper chaperone A